MSPLSPDLLAVLRCPVTGSTLVHEGEFLVSSVTDSTGSPVRYSIDEGIPVLLRPELLVAATEAGSDEHDGPAAN
ncbi:Trm112 family protein [Arthrobacter sp. CAN_A1]|uniref:Trm112 family protein n=1 Tax=Arthrobacter sp. CAN_A1 TaxID=2787717 RepID=UPI0018CBD660